jgi:hypothetical protein
MKYNILKYEYFKIFKGNKVYIMFVPVSDHTDSTPCIHSLEYNSVVSLYNACDIGKEVLK